MPTSNFNLIGISAEIMLLLKKEAKKLNTSVNSLILDIIERELGYRKTTYHDLDYLAGSWSASEEKAFVKNTHFFEK